MKLLLLTLALACYSLVSAQAPDGFTLVPPAEFRGDPAIQASLDFGAQQVIRQGKERNLPNERYQISRVISVYKLVEDETDYQFTVQLTGDQGSVVDATYMVSVSGGNTREVTSYEYSVQGTDITGSSEDGDGEEEEDIAGGWTELDLSEVENDPEILAILDFGVQNITQQEIAAGKIPDGTYKVERIRSAFSQVVAGTNYRFDVDITDDKGLVLRATLIVYEPLDGSNEVTSYAYIVTATDLPEGSTSVDPSELDTNQGLRAALDNGVASIVQQLISAHQLPESTYSIMEVNSIYAQGATDNRFDVSLRNCAGLIARVVFTVSGSQEATLGSLNITSIPEEGLIGGDC